MSELILNTSKSLKSLRQLEHILGYERRVLFEVAHHVGSYYEQFDIRENAKKKWRHVENPNEILKKIQARINKKLILEHNVDMPNAFNGGIKGRSIISNASPHVGKKQIITLDLQNYFYRTKTKKVYDVFEKRFGCSAQIASLLTKLTTFGFHLPVGAPTSPGLANWVLLPLYEDLQRIAEPKGITLSIYFDDITLSGEAVTSCLQAVKNTIQKHGHAIQESKTKIMLSSESQRVTGITVNRKLSAGRERMRDVTVEITRLSQADEVTASALRSIRGKIAYIGNICKQQGKRLERFAELSLPKSSQLIAQTRRPLTRSCDSWRNRHDASE